MGLTKSSTGAGTLSAMKLSKGLNERIITLAGNPNVGKSTVFNSLTGMKQHTGNWTGKTVSNAMGEYCFGSEKYILVDVPGTYSLMASSVEEEVARDFICFGDADCCVIVADATCLERNLNLVLQITEATSKVVLCVNLIDEARKKQIEIDLDELSLQLGIPVVATAARSGKGLDKLCEEVSDVCSGKRKTYSIKVDYDDEIESALEILTPVIEGLKLKLNARWTALKLLDCEETFINSLNEYIGFDLWKNEKVKAAMDIVNEKFNEKNISSDLVRDMIVSGLVQRAERIAKYSVNFKCGCYNRRDRRLDRIFTSRATGIPIMLLMFGLIFWITITGANYPSSWLSEMFGLLEVKLSSLLLSSALPLWVEGIFIQGIYKTLAWVISVMLPPMAIFFPMFTLLEDLGYLPRVAFNMDKFFRSAGAHGKQSLTMAMGFGCNACGVVGCRIIDSPRERLIAIVTNNFVPCNGRFPTLISIITMFFCGAAVGLAGSALSAVFLLGVIVLGVFMTLMISKLLSATVLKGMPSSFTLELPPYRVPQVSKVIVRSIFDRTLFVLGRAVVVAIPAGALIWILANITVGNMSLLAHCANFLDPFASFIGLDGVILLAFILGFPANEIVFPIIIMAYMATGTLTELSDLTALRTLLCDNGWTSCTAICTMLFCLFHFPCSTTCLTIKKETKSLKWTAASILIPTVTGIVICGIVANAYRLIEYVL